MCEQCEGKASKYNYQDAIRPCPATDIELALLAKARRTKDPKKLAAMVPAWIKREMASKLPRPRVFVADKAPIFPAWTRGTPNLDPHGYYTFPNEYWQGREGNKDTASYVAEFYKENHLRA